MKQWNLSYESLTSNAATECHRQLCLEDTDFVLEFARFNLSAVTGSPETDSEQHDAAFCDHDDDLILSIDQVQGCVNGTVMPVDTGNAGKFLSSVEDAEDDFEDVNPDDQQSDSECEVSSGLSDHRPICLLSVSIALRFVFPGCLSCRRAFRRWQTRSF